MGECQFAPHSPHWSKWCDCTVDFLITVIIFLIIIIILVMGLMASKCPVSQNTCSYLLWYNLTQNSLCPFCFDPKWPFVSFSEARNTLGALRLQIHADLKSQNRSAWLCGQANVLICAQWYVLRSTSKDPTVSKSDTCNTTKSFYKTNHKHAHTHTPHTR